MKALAGLMVVLFVFSGCSSTSRKAHNQFKNFIHQKNYEKALEVAKSSEFFPDENSKLIKLLELGTLYHLKGQYYQSLMFLDQANDLSHKLFTKSISKKITSFVSNGNSDNYYGAKYERSLIYFYLALNHLMIWQQGYYGEHYKLFKFEKGELKFKDLVKRVDLDRNQRLTHLSAARANILGWDSTLETYQTKLNGKSAYKNDLVAKVFGASIHEIIGSSTDYGIAKNLYKKAEEVLFKNYNAYPAFNKKYKKFIDDFDKFPKMSLAKVKANYVDQTDYSVNLNKFLKENESKKKKSNLFVVLQDGMVASKKARVIKFPIGFQTLPVGVGNKGGFITFVRRVLGFSKGTNPSIAFELPEVERKATTDKFAIIVKDKSQKVVAESSVALLDPVSEIAYENLDNEIGSVYATVGARLVTNMWQH